MKHTCFSTSNGRNSIQKTYLFSSFFEIFLVDFRIKNRLKKSNKGDIKGEPYPSRSQEPSKRLPRGPKELPNGPQEGPKSHQKRSKRAPRGLQSAPRACQRGLGGSREACSRREEPQEGSKVLQEGVREASDAPKRPVRGARRLSWPKTRPKKSQGSSKRDPECPRVAKRVPRGPSGAAGDDRSAVTLIISPCIGSALAPQSLP